MPINEQVFAAAQAGDPQALEQLLTQLQPDIRRYARLQCDRSSAVEDIVQEALLIVYRRVGTVRSLSALGKWLVRVVQRLCILPVLMFLRHQPLQGEEGGIQTDSDHLVMVPQDDLRLDLVRALEQLPSSYREMILLRDMQEMSLGEISVALNITLEATKSRLHRARTMMRGYLQLAADERRLPAK